MLGDDLALLRQLEPSLERPGRQAEDRPVRRPATSPDPPSPPVEQRQLDTVPLGGRHERGLGDVQEPVRGEVAGLLVRVRVAEHHLLPIPAPPEMRAVGRVGQDRVEDTARGLERRRVLEQRNHIDREAPAAVRQPAQRGKLEHGPNVARRRREADDVALRGRRTVPRLDGRQRSERLRDLGGSDARRDLGGRGDVDAQRVERTLVNGTVLADLERGEMEPERRELPAQVLDLAPRDPPEPLRDEGILQLRQLGVELICGLVPPGERGLLAGEVRPSPADPLGDEPEPLAVRLVGVAASELPIELGEQLGIASEAGGERPRNGLAGR